MFWKTPKTLRHETPKKERIMLKSLKPHIGIFGKRNNGKSSIINVLAGEEVAIVSDFAGTTTDPVDKTMEITNLGPVVMIDTAGIDDVGEIGKKRVDATYKVIKSINLAIIVITKLEWSDFEKDIVKELEKKNIPYFVINNKSDVFVPDLGELKNLSTLIKTEIFPFSVKNILEKKEVDSLETIIESIKKYLPDSLFNNPTILGDLVSYGDVVLLVTPIDVEAPKGRLILPQVQTIRDCLDNEAIAIVVKERELDLFFEKIKVKPKLAVTDSQVFLKADASIPKDIPLTSFSILFARLKGDFDAYVRGTRKIGTLKDGDRVLILESCSHHVSCDDIGRVKVPRWLTNFTGKKLHYDVVSGLGELPYPIEEYSLVVQCGGCVLTRKQVLNRINLAIEKNIPVTNYGMCIAYCHGIFERAIAPFYNDHDQDNGSSITSL